MTLLVGSTTLDVMNALVRVIVICWLALAVACTSTASSSPAVRVAEVPTAAPESTPIPLRVPAEQPTAAAVATAPSETRRARSEPAVTTEPSVDRASDLGLPVEVVEEIPDGYALLGHTRGDLDLDGRVDLAIIIHEPGDADFGEIADIVPVRPVMLFTAQPSGTFELVARSDGAALCGRCGGTFGDPFVDLIIENGRISIGHYGGSAWRWTYTPTFAYDIVEDDWVLSGISQSSFHASDPDATIEDHSTTDVDPVVFSEFVANG